MEHDFGATTSTPRFSSQNEPCTGIGGYMDYQPNPNRWSPCSVEDFTGYFEQVNPWCLTPLTNDPTTTTVTTTSTSTTTTTTPATTTSTSTTTTTTTSTGTTSTTSSADTTTTSGCTDK